METQAISRFRGLRLRDSRVRIRGLGFIGFRVEGLGFRSGVVSKSNRVYPEQIHPARHFRFISTFTEVIMLLIANLHCAIPIVP